MDTRQEGRQSDLAISAGLPVSRTFGDGTWSWPGGDWGLAAPTEAIGFFLRPTRMTAALVGGTVGILQTPVRAEEIAVASVVQTACPCCPVINIERIPAVMQRRPGLGQASFAVRRACRAVQFIEACRDGASAGLRKETHLCGH